MTYSKRRICSTGESEVYTRANLKCNHAARCKWALGSRPDRSHGIQKQLAPLVFQSHGVKACVYEFDYRDYVYRNVYDIYIYMHTHIYIYMYVCMYIYIYDVLYSVIISSYQYVYLHGIWHIMSRIVEVLPACCPRMLIVILPLCPWCDISTEIATAKYAWSVPKYSKVKFKQTRRLGAIRKLSRLELPRLFSERRNRSPLPSPEGLPVAKSFSLDTRWQALKALVRGKNLGCGSRRLCENWAPQEMGLLFSLVKVKVQSLWVAGASFLQPHACWSHGVRTSWNRYDRCAEFWKQRNSKVLLKLCFWVLGAYGACARGYYFSLVFWRWALFYVQLCGRTGCLLCHSHPHWGTE